MLVGWSHKYKEVLDMFDLGRYAIDYSQLNIEDFKTAFAGFIAAEKEIREKIEVHYEDVISLSERNIQEAEKVLNHILEKPPRQKSLLDTSSPERYIGPYRVLRKGYAEDESIRQNAASGGMVTAMLIHLLKTGRIDGAWVTKSHIENGALGYKTFVATTEEEIKSASSSIYMSMPLFKHIDRIKAFDGKIAVVLTPCMMRAFNNMIERDQSLREKIVIKLGLFCSGDCDKTATEFALKKAGLSLKDAVRLYYRRGNWRGQSSVLHCDGSEKAFSYTKTICAYKNAGFFMRKRCLTCQDHFAGSADISFGDIWLKPMKKEPFKHTCCVIRTEAGEKLYESAASSGAIISRHVSAADMILGQKRALVFKFNCARAKDKELRDQDTLDDLDKCKWNHRLAYRLTAKNSEYSIKKPESLYRLPMWFVYYYMCFIRALLNF